MLTLRPYQEEAILAGLSALDSGLNPIISLPTGAGKSLCLAAICKTYREASRRVLVVSHRKELLEQDAAALATLDPSISSGIYSAGLARRDVEQPVIFGGVQSIYSRMAELQQAGAFGLIIVDECHLIPRDAETMYGSVFREVPHAHRLGLTATPYRLDSGLLHEGPGAMFDTMAIHIEPSRLVPDYLSPLVGVGTDQRMSVAGVASARGDFITRELEESAMDADLIRHTVTEMIRLGYDRHHWLVFCITVAHAEAVRTELEQQGVPCSLLTGETPKEERAALITDFKAGTVRVLVNVLVLTTGFDAPITDCLVMLRPTQSKGLWVQCLGRGMRKSPEKKNCRVLDFAGNIARHGSIDYFAEYLPSNREKQEQTEKEARAAQARKIMHDTHAAWGDPMGASTPLEEYHVISAQYFAQPSKKVPGATNIVVTYRCVEGTIRQWICPEYPTGARWHAQQWFRRRGVGLPTTTTEAMRSIRALPVPLSLTTQMKGTFRAILVEHWADVPSRAPSLFD